MQYEQNFWKVLNVFRFLDAVWDIDMRDYTRILVAVALVVWQRDHSVRWQGCVRPRSDVRVLRKTMVAGRGSERRERRHTFERQKEKRRTRSSSGQTDHPVCERSCPDHVNSPPPHPSCLRHALSHVTVSLPSFSLLIILFLPHLLSRDVANWRRRTRGTGCIDRSPSSDAQHTYKIDYIFIKYFWYLHVKKQ